MSLRGECILGRVGIRSGPSILGAAGISNPGGAVSTLYTGLVSYWKMDEASGTRSDSVGTNHLTDNNTVTSGAGILGTAGTYVAGNGEFLSVADNPTISFADNDFSFSVWARMATKTVNRPFMVKHSGVGNFEYAIRYTQFNDRITCVLNTTVVADTVLGSPVLDTWYLCVGVHDTTADQVRFYINAGTPTTVALVGGTVDSTGPLLFGRDSNISSVYQDGMIDDAAIWNRVLTAAEIAELYNGGAGKALF
jgi:hypothetical protein